MNISKSNGRLHEPKNEKICSYEPGPGHYGAKCESDSDCDSKRCGLNGEKKYCRDRGECTASGLTCLEDRDCGSDKCNIAFDNGQPILWPVCVLRLFDRTPVLTCTEYYV